jgi:hypothetical protein
MYIAVVKSVYIEHNQISVNGECLEHCHVRDIAEMCHGM